MSDPVEVIHEALLAPVPCPRCAKAHCRCLLVKGSRLRTQAQMIAEALIQAGLIAVPQAEPSAADYVEMAKWLAEQSQNPRYIHTREGWRKLLESERDVSVAHAAAVKTLGTASGEQMTQLGRVRDALVADIRKRRASAAAGE